jgi:lipoate-protein ligase B
LLLEHPPVLTAGRGTAEGSLKVDAAVLAGHGLEVVPVSRGGDVTWHGPGQLVGYPICELGIHGRDLHRFLRGLETALMASLKRFGIESHQTEGLTGVWVGDRKIASIGIAVRRWVSYHGFALNVCPNLDDFELIHPCGLAGVRMTSMRELKGDACPAFDDVQATVAADVAFQLGYAGVREGDSQGVAA